MPYCNGGRYLHRHLRSIHPFLTNINVDEGRNINLITPTADLIESLAVIGRLIDEYIEVSGRIQVSCTYFSYNEERFQNDGGTEGGGREEGGRVDRRGEARTCRTHSNAGIATGLEPQQCTYIHLPKDKRATR